MPHTPCTGPRPGMIAGENGCPAYASADSACVDLFFGAVPDIPTEELHAKLAAAWGEDRALTLKLIFNLGNVRKRGGGKMDRGNFYKAMAWLWGVSPDTVIANVGAIAEHTSLQCVLDVLMHVVHRAADAGPGLGAYDVCVMQDRQLERELLRKSIRSDDGRLQRRRERRQRRAALWEAFARGMGTTVEALRVPRTTAEYPTHRDFLRTLPRRVWDDPRMTTMWKDADIAGQYQAFAKHIDAGLAEAMKSARRARQAQTDQALRERCAGGSPLGRLRDAVADLFADGLAEEHRAARAGTAGAGLYAKWAPTPGGRHDKATRVAALICLRLVDRGVLEVVAAPAGAGKEDHMKVVLGAGLSARGGREAPQHLLEQCYHRDLLAPLRREAGVPEHFAGRGEWGKVDYTRMASTCRFIHGERVFRRHDRERYDRYLLEGGKVNASTLLPHAVVKRAREAADDVPKRVEANLQWHGIVHRVRATLAAKEAGSAPGYSPGWLPMCDVSGSMYGTPREVAVSLSLLMAEAQPEGSPWHGKVLTFSTTPEFVELSGVPTYGQEGETATDEEDAAAVVDRLGDLAGRAEALVNANWCMSTNIAAAFDMVLEVARAHDLSAGSMRDTTLCIFSDMEFDACCSWDLPMHAVAAAKFAAAGYPDLPRIVFWNLRHSQSVPIHDVDVPGVSLLAGDSPNLVKAFLENPGADKEEAATLTECLDSNLKAQDGGTPVAPAAGAAAAPLRTTKNAVTPRATMMKVLEGEAYDRLRVVPPPPTARPSDQAGGSPLGGAAADPLPEDDGAQTVLRLCTARISDNHSPAHDDGNLRYIHGDEERVRVGGAERFVKRVGERVLQTAAPLAAVETTAAVFRDQGWGNRKGGVFLVVKRGGAVMYSVSLLGTARDAPEENVRRRITDPLPTWDVAPGDVLCLAYHVGGGGGHELVVEDLCVDVTLGRPRADSAAADVPPAAPTATSPPALLSALPRLWLPPGPACLPRLRSRLSGAPAVPTSLSSMRLLGPMLRRMLCM
eukprot:TRINITY_DN4595_c0_g3_i1.p1 TRINITY_DN4595_c0_g3~~TRINITY_DN4595_c0_g3_i1.p1  ORF type:complete len:1018 (+),score=266.43 TRINITY_DN4595_c0_g3_i1:85-3138(+)